MGMRPISPAGNTDPNNIPISNSGSAAPLNTDNANVSEFNHGFQSENAAPPFPISDNLGNHNGGMAMADGSFNGVSSIGSNYNSMGETAVTDTIGTAIAEATGNSSRATFLATETLVATKDSYIWFPIDVVQGFAQALHNCGLDWPSVAIIMPFIIKGTLQIPLTVVREKIGSIWKYAIHSFENMKCSEYLNGIGPRSDLPRRSDLEWLPVVGCFGSTSDLRRLRRFRSYGDGPEDFETKKDATEGQLTLCGVQHNRF
jgi:hypothetical protein